MSVNKEDCDKNVKTMTEKIDKVKDKLVEFEVGVTKAIAEMPKKLTDELDNRYANKKTEKTVDKVIWLVLAAFIVSVLGLLWK